MRIPLVTISIIAILATITLLSVQMVRAATFLRFVCQQTDRDRLDELVQAHRDNYKNFQTFSATVNVEIIDKIKPGSIVSLKNGANIVETLGKKSTFVVENAVHGSKCSWKYFDEHGNRSEQLLFDGEKWHIYSPYKKRIEIVESENAGGRFLTDLRELGAIDGKGKLFDFLNEFADIQLEQIEGESETISILAKHAYAPDQVRQVEMVCDSRFAFLPTMILTRWNSMPLQCICLEYSAVDSNWFPAAVTVKAYSDETDDLENAWQQAAIYRIGDLTFDDAIAGETLKKLDAPKGTLVRDLVKGETYRYGEFPKRYSHWISVAIVSVCVLFVCMVVRIFKGREHNDRV